MLNKIKVFSRSKDHVRCVSLVRENRSSWHAVRAFRAKFDRARDYENRVHGPRRTYIINNGGSRVM